MATRLETLTFEGQPLPERLPLGPITDECRAHGFTPSSFQTTPGHLVLVVEGEGSTLDLGESIREYLEGLGSTGKGGGGGMAFGAGGDYIDVC